MTEPEFAAGQARTPDQVREVINAVIAELAPNPDGLTSPDSKLVDDLEYHSLALLELAFTLEDEFDLEPIDEETARAILTVRDVTQHVLSEMDTRASAARPGR